VGFLETPDRLEKTVITNDWRQRMDANSRDVIAPFQLSR
jgi:hypothetical protein